MDPSKFPDVWYMGEEHCVQTINKNWEENAVIEYSSGVKWVV